MEKTQTLSPATGTRKRHYQVSLDAMKMAPESIMRMMDKERVAERGRHTILVVSFDHDAIRFKEDAMRHFGYRVKSASTFEEATKIFKDGGIGLILSECHMPEINAISMLRAYTDHAEDAKVILVTSRKVDGNGVGLLMNCGAVEVIEKPYKLANLVFTIDAHLAVARP